jgi:hypothetical protein
MGKGYSLWQAIKRADIEQLDAPGGEAKLWVAIRILFFAALDRVRAREGVKIMVIIVIDPPEEMALVELKEGDDLKPIDDDEDGLHES